MRQPPTLTFRVAEPADLPRLAEIDAQWQTDYRCLRIEQAVLERRCWVAVEGESPRAYGLLNHDWFGYPFIELLVVHPADRRQGIGRALLRHLVAAADREKVFTSTNESNAAMRGLLEMEGFRRSGVIENLDEGDAELVFVRMPRSAEPPE